MVRIDGEEYHELGLLKVSKGSGDDLDEFSFKQLRDNDQNSYWLLTDTGKWWLFKEITDTAQKQAFTIVYEEFKADKVSGNNFANISTKFSWGAFKDSYGEAPLPFSGTNEGLIVCPSRGEERHFMSIPLLAGGVDNFYSANFPAAKMPVAKVDLSVSNIDRLVAGPALITRVGLLLFVVFALGFLFKTPVPARLFWIVGPLSLTVLTFSRRGSLWHEISSLVASLFCFHFATHSLDNIVTGGDEDSTPIFESFRLAIESLLLVGLRLVSPRNYFVIRSSSLWAGGCSLLVYFIFVVIISGENEYNYFQWFNYYAGSGWGFIWLLALLLLLMKYSADFRRVPMDYPSFKRIIYSIGSILESEIDELPRWSDKLVLWADDLRDAIEISTEPCVRALKDLIEPLKTLGLEAAILKEIGPANLDDETKQALADDIKTIREDFQTLHDEIDAFKRQESSTMSLPRVSPLISTWNN